MNTIVRNRNGLETISMLKVADTVAQEEQELLKASQAATKEEAERRRLEARAALEKVVEEKDVFIADLRELLEE